MKKVDYAKEIVNQLYEHHFPKDTYNLEIHQVQKNNGLILTGITIRENDNTICPSFYVEGYQSEYTPKEAAREIASQYYKRLDKDKNLILEHYEDGFDDFDKIKEPERPKIEVPANVTALAEERLVARKAKNWAESDRLRNEINALGYAIKDTATGYEITLK